MNSDQFIALVKKIYQYIVRHIFLRNLVLAFLILVTGTFVIMVLLKIYTRHNEEISVPDLRGLTLADASETLSGKRMEAVVFDSVFLTDFERGTVVEQHPKAGFKVKRHRKIFLTMNAMNPERIPMPDLISLTFRQATARLETYNLKVGEITYEPDIGINLVLQQKLRGREILPGDSVSKGSYIDLALGKGLSDELSAVPLLTGLTLDVAILRAADRFLRIGGILDDNTIVSAEDRAAARIYQQRPEAAAESTLPLGSSIDVWITLDTTKIPVTDTLISITDEAEENLDF